MQVSTRRFILFCLLALISIHGIIYLPVHPSFEFKGLDFQNIYTYSVKCLSWPVPYEKTGTECGDVLGRPMLYPPLLFYTMTFWPKFFTFHEAAYIWEVVLLVMTTFAAILLWSLERRKSLMTLLGFGLIYPQLPVFYAMERGNNDAVVILLWAIGTYLYVKKNDLFWSGFLLGTATAFKVYPGFGCIGLFLAFAFSKDWKSLFRLGYGTAAGFLLFFILFLPSSWTYFMEVAPRYSHDHSVSSYFGHSLFRGPDSLLIKIPLLILLGWGFSKRIKNDALLCFSFFATYGTFIPNTANDYSLLTAMPMALILLHRSLREKTSSGEWAFFMILMFAFFGDRTPFAWINFSRGHQLLFIACFIALSFIMAKWKYFMPDHADDPAWRT
jgi:hypothetical protein